MIKNIIIALATVFIISSLSMANEDNAKSILLVIDMQNDLLTPGKAGMKMDSTKIEFLIQNVNDNIRCADSLGMQIAYIQNLWTNPLWLFFSGNVCKKGDKETDFDKRLNLVNATVFEKSVPNSFSNKDLVEFMIKRKIEKVYICGIKSEACVSTTVKNSIKKGYTTFIIEPSIGANSLKRLTKDLSKLERLGAIKIQKIGALGG